MKKLQKQNSSLFFFLLSLLFFFFSSRSSVSHTHTQKKQAHRLKNAETLTSRAIGALPCRARVLLSGTPLQNRLDEFYAMVDFANPGVLGSIAEFRKRYEAPILAGREPGAAAEAAALGAERAATLSSVVNDFILRRTNALLSAHLPPKIVEVICCRLSPLQRALYDHFLGSVAGAKALLKGPSGAGSSSSAKGTAKVLSAITSLRKLCNHPKLIWDAIAAKKAAGSASSSSGMPDAFAGCEQLFPEEFFGGGAGARGGGRRGGGGGGLARILGRGGAGGPPPGWEQLSGKFALAAALLAALHARGGASGGGGGGGGGSGGGSSSSCGGFSAPASVGSSERIVIVSNATQTLDLFVALCRQRNYPFLRLDGSTSISKRTKLVAQFNDPTRREFVFLLSSKAGGCGLNLVGANRLLLFDPAWNPADDKQAAARVWRDGQKRRVYVYRLLATGTLDEKIWQRQCSKEGLKCVVDGAAGAGDANDDNDALASAANGGDDDGLAAPENAALMSTEELRDLFTLRADVASDTLDAIEASEGRGKGLDGSEEDELARGAAASAAAASASSSSVRPQDGKPAEEDIAKYARHSRVFDVDDDAIKEAAATCPGVISFVFSLKVDGKKLDDDDETDGNGGGGVGGVAKAVPPASAPASAAVAAPPPSSSGVAVAPLQQQLLQLRGSALGIRSRLGLGGGLGGAAPRTATLASLTPSSAAARPAALRDATNTDIAADASRAFTAPARAGALPAAKRAKAGAPLAALVGGGHGRGGIRGGAAAAAGGGGGRGRGRGAGSGAAAKPKGRGRNAASSDEEDEMSDDDESEEESEEEFESEEEEEEEAASEGEEKENEDAASPASTAPSKTPEQPRAAFASAVAGEAPVADAVAAAAATVPAPSAGGSPSRQSLSSLLADPASGGRSDRKIRSASEKSRSPLYADDDDDFM